MRAFVSSTYIDLTGYRQSAINALQRLNLDVRNMEMFGASTMDATHVSFEAIDECDYFAGIYAHRYGLIPTCAIKSITEQEFDYAFQRKGVSLHPEIHITWGCSKTA